MHKSNRLPFTIAAHGAAFAARNGNIARRTLAPASYATRLPWFSRLIAWLVE